MKNAGSVNADINNRILLILPPKKFSIVKVCDGGVCRTKKVELPPKWPILKYLQKTAPAPGMYLVFDAAHPTGKSLMQDLAIKEADLPLFLKEFEPGKQRRAFGMSARDISKLWDDWYISPPLPQQEQETPEKPECLPTFGASGSRWTHPFYQSIRQHLMDTSQVHHLPKAVVDTWTDRQCETWHAWHHDVLSGRIKTVRPR